MHRQRRGLFSSNVAAYAEGRPGYPERVYELLVERCGLGPGSRVLEIGPGTGQATERLLDLGASVTAVELGVEFARFLVDKFSGRDLDVVVGAFEEVDLAAGNFDLVAAATSFHWVPTAPGLGRCADVLRESGWLALWWSNFGDPNRPDPFHNALSDILTELAPTLLDPPHTGAPGSGSPLDQTRRIADIDATRRFGPVSHEVVAWTGCHTSKQLRAMFASFSPWLALPHQQRSLVLDAVEALASNTFGGVVERPYLTTIYFAQRMW